MNQVTNKIPYGLLSEEEQAQFCGKAKKRGLYELWNNEWYGASGNRFACVSTYRLIIKDDEWYYIELNKIDIKGRVIHGSNIGYLRSCYTVRPATAEEIEAAKPKELTIEEKIKAEYPDYEVVMLIKSGSFWGLWRNPHGPFQPHVMAPSLTGFYRYVYHHLDGNWDTYTSPTMQWAKDETLQPIAVLFTRDK